MPVAWDDSKERQFLLTIIHVTNPGAPNWNKVAELLNAQAGGGSDYVGNALRQRFAKMKKDAIEQYGAMPAGNGESAEPKAPGKRGGVKKANGATSAQSTGKRKSKKAASEEASDEGEDESATPSKKVKSEQAAGEDDDDFF